MFAFKQIFGQGQNFFLALPRLYRMHPMPIFQYLTVVKDSTRQFSHNHRTKTAGTAIDIWVARMVFAQTWLDKKMAASEVQYSVDKILA